MDQPMSFEGSFVEYVRVLWTFGLGLPCPLMSTWTMLMQVGARLSDGSGLDDLSISFFFPPSSSPNASLVDYRKGCYVGQELVSRTYHTGVIRKRMVPVQLIPLSSDHGSYDPTKPPILDPSIQLVFPPPQTDIRKMTSRPGKTRSAGRWAGGIHNIGLALLRLEDIRERQPLTLTMVDGQDMLLSPYIPSWWPISKDLSPSSSLSESKRS